MYRKGIHIKLNVSVSQLYQSLLMCLTGIMDIESEVFLILIFLIFLTYLRLNYEKIGLLVHDPSKSYGHIL